ncbi:hypothetical protein AKJ64_01505 [candidate division MSBL1 archaeon SCGC-AAA259E17]|uniref:FAD-binding PCMH-type domain-containing protein n=1 Tax=candidate division MSBL1 archaeon SCGC-AAA259E17 TaxID=1698263 RepID=A0A133UFX9_9EURY|nr:hypothetical protein AKJ64_01505 [candidate division MSBL1 archaeon SCGC-AAA259E17]
MKDSIVKELENLIGEDWVIDDERLMEDYLSDETPSPVRPEADRDVILVKPKNSQEISEILKYANRKSISVVPRGAGTGLCGAAVPVQSSIILSMERLNDLIEVDEDNFTMTCQAGVTLEDILERVRESETLFFPPHPGDEGAQVGGLVVENAGGARAVKYGVLRNYVRGMEVVLPTGEITSLGGKVIKNNTGLDLMHLLIGSEGTLGIVSRVTLRLYPEPQASVSLIVPFEGRHEAIGTVPQILKQGMIPLAMEYMERDLVEKSAEHIGKKWPVREGDAYLYLVLTGQDKDSLYSKCERINETCDSRGSQDVLVAERRKDEEKILDIRSNIYTALEPESADILDVTVPITEIGRLLDEIDSIAEEHDLDIPVYGHAGDGNLHPHIRLKDGRKPSNMERIKDEIYEKTIDLGGVITGEHGIGKTRVKNLPQALDDHQISLMKKIKKVFDPNNILNPKTVVDIDED